MTEEKHVKKQNLGKAMYIVSLNYSSVLLLLNTESLENNKIIEKDAW